MPAPPRDPKVRETDEAALSTRPSERSGPPTPPTWRCGPSNPPSRADDGPGKTSVTRDPPAASSRRPDASSLHDVTYQATDKGVGRKAFSARWRRFPNTHVASATGSIRRSRTAGGARRDRTDDLLLAKQALSQLSYGPGRIGQGLPQGEPHPRMVGLGRLERPTSPLSGVRSNHLSYRPAPPRAAFAPP